MKRTLIAALVLAFAGWLCVVQFAPRASAAPPSDNPAQVRLLTGTVTDKSEAPLPNAVVYLKNTKTLAVKTFITDDKGQFRFPALLPNVDYQVYAEYKGRKSDTKTLSSFDSRSHAIINVKVDMGK